MLSKANIQALGLVPNGVSTNYRDSSYDASVGLIVDKDGNSHTHLDIPPRGVVHVISNESFVLPATHAGVAHVKTALCNEGLLTLNIGLIDPGYSGPITTAVLNFGSKPARLSRGDVFLRIAFHQLIGPVPPVPTTIVSKLAGETELEVKIRALSRFSGDFLDVSGLVKAVAKRQGKSIRNNMLAAAGLIGVLFTTLGILVPIAINYSTFYMAKDVVHLSRDGAETSLSIEAIAATNTELQTKLSMLESEIASVKIELTKKADKNH
jgi:dUTPase